ANSPVSGAVSFSPDSKTMTFTPTSAFVDGTYTATATAKDAAGNATTTTWSFTVDGAAPVNQSTSPATGSTVKAPATVSAVYNEALDTAASSLTVCPGSVTPCDGTKNPLAGSTQFSGDHKTVVFVPASTITDGAYTATAVVKDPAGNGPVTTTWNFTVNDLTAPVNTATSPLDAAHTKTPAAVSASYDEPIDAGGGSFTFTLTNTDTNTPVAGTPPNLNGAVSGS